MDFDRSYADVPALFGDEPEPLLVDHLERLDRTRPVLDIGAGQGRNSLYLARRGLHVHAIDPSAEAIRQLAAVASDEGLALRADAVGFDDVDGEGYGGVLVFGLIPLLAGDGVERLVASVTRVTAPGGHAFVTAFTTDDPRAATGRWNYLPPGSLAAAFADDFDVEHAWEGLGPWHRHGDGEPERHGMAEVVLRRR